jgi:intracellular proteinase inhibitor BsuPI
MRRIRHLALAVVVVVGAACSNDTGLTSPTPDALQAADRLARLADSVSLTDNATASTIRGLADVVRLSGAVATVTIAVDGQPHDYSAVANETVLTIPCTTTASSGEQATGTCGSVPLHRRSLVAWEPGTRRMLVLTTVDESGPIGPGSSDTPSARLHVFTGDATVWWGVSGAQSNSLTLGKECRSITRQVGDKLVTMTCHEAEFRWKFSATLSTPMPSTDGSTSSVQQHTVELPESSVHGTQWAVSVIVRPSPPSEPPPASPLAATLRVSIDSLVHLTFVVRNRADARIDLKFGTSKTHDFLIADRGGTVLWRWSDGRRFTSASTTLSIAPHDSIVFSDQWPPTVHGDLIAAAMLTSATQNVAARAAFTIP